MGPRGIENDMIDTMAAYLNFTYYLVHCGQVWGTHWKNGTYQGVFGKVQSGEADLGASELSLTHERSLTFDFTMEHARLPITFITSELPPRRPNMALTFYKPFKLST